MFVQSLHSNVDDTMMSCQSLYFHTSVQPARVDIIRHQHVSYYAELDRRQSSNTFKGRVGN